MLTVQYQGDGAALNVLLHAYITEKTRPVSG
jgi:hypothetical protein